MLTKGAIGNLINRYKSVLVKCNLINTFGSLAVAAALVLGGAGVANALDVLSSSKEWDTKNATYTTDIQLQNNVTISYLSKEKLDSIEVNGHITTTAGSSILTNRLISSVRLSNMTELNIDYIECPVIWNSDNGKITADTVIVSNSISIGQDNDKNENTKVSSEFIVKNLSVGNKITNKKDSTLTVTGELNTPIIYNAGDIQLNGADAKVDSITKYDDDDYTNSQTYNPYGNVRMNNSSLSLKEGESIIGSLSMTKSTLDIADGVNVSVNELSGDSASATIGAKVNEDGTVSSGSLVAAKSDLKTLAVAYNGINADAFASKEAAAEFAQNTVQLGDETNESQTEISGVIEGGDINGTITFDGKGNSTMDKSELMDAALQQASVATVSLDRILTNDVRKRLGDIRSDKNTTGVWMRWDGGKLKGDSGLTNNFNTIQIGGDTKAAKNCRIGFAGSFTHGDTDFSRGNGELEGFSFALYGTWMGENGMFADVVARLGKFSTEMNVDGNKGDMDNRVASLSGEYGWRFNVCDQFFVEPQVELAYTYVSSDDLQLGKNHYEFDNVDSLTGRAGVVAGWQLPEERGNVYARASVVQQFMGDAKISGTNGVANNVQEIDGEDTWLEYGIGANVKLTDSTYVWADVERTEGADIEEEWRGTVGVRFSF